MSSISSPDGSTKSGGDPNSTIKGKPSSNNKSSDSSKPDKNDLNPKIQIKPTAEQMQLALLLDSKRSEEPELLRKIQQIMEITRTTEDQASMALHSRDYDVERAITLLTEDGGELALESEWVCVGKNRKHKTTRQKSKAYRGRGANLRGQGRSRGGIKPGRGGRFDKKDFGRSYEQGDRGGRGYGVGGRNLETRTFVSRTRGTGRERSDVAGDSLGDRNDVWDLVSQGGTAKPQTMKVDEWFGQDEEVDDWEEYQGTLNDTKVFTPSLQQSTPTANESKKISSQEQQIAGNGSIVPGQNIDLSLILQKANNTPSANNPANSQSAGATILAALKQASTSNTASNHGLAQQQGLQQPHKIQKSRVPLTKIPASSAVEMPDIPSMSDLDVQFGELKFGCGNYSISSLTFANSTFGGISQQNPGGQQQDPSSIITGLYSNASSGQTDSSRNFPSSGINKDSSFSHNLEGSISVFPNQNQMTGLLQDSNSQRQQHGAESGVSSLTSPYYNIPIVEHHSQMSNIQQQQQSGGNAGSYTNPGSGFSILPPGFPLQTAASTYINPVNAYGQLEQQQQPNYLLSYGGRIVSNSAPIVTQSQQQHGYGVPSNYGGSGGGSSNVNSNQYGSYQPFKSTALNTTTNVSSNTLSIMGTGHNSRLSQQQIGASSSGGMTQQPGMVMPQYILNQGGLPTYYSVQPPSGGSYMAPSLQQSPKLTGYLPYDANSVANYGCNPASTVRRRTYANVVGFSDSPTTASPVPSNIQGQAGGTMYPGNYPGQMPGYYYLGNNMVHPYGPPPPHLYQTTAITQTNPISTNLNTSMYANKGQHMNNRYEHYSQTTSSPYSSLGGNLPTFGVYVVQSDRARVSRSKSKQKKEVFKKNYHKKETQK